MCCFSQQVEMVADTNIFSRSANGRQFLVYSMTYAAATDLAMVLPLPVPANPPEDAVRFINLERYPHFFADMRRGFPQFVSEGYRHLGPGPMVEAAPKLKVHEMGSFEASFVPRIADFDRLDERFRIPRDVWDQLPAYRDFGFAVFKLKSSPQRAPGLFRRLFGGGSSANTPPTATPGPRWRPVSARLPPRQVHPMAFEFPRRNPDLLYFPTVHIHDRKVHTRASFDHMLYCQPDPQTREYLQGWQSSSGEASTFVDIRRTQGIIIPNQLCYRRPLVGSLENKDTLIGKEGSIPVFSAR
jgi:hypothetical protein